MASTTHTAHVDTACFGGFIYSGQCVKTLARDAARLEMAELHSSRPGRKGKGGQKCKGQRTL